MLAHKMPSRVESFKHISDERAKAVRFRYSGYPPPYFAFACDDDRIGTPPRDGIEHVLWMFAWRENPQVEQDLLNRRLASIGEPPCYCIQVQLFLLFGYSHIVLSCRNR